jgi:replicative DNA helicase
MSVLGAMLTTDQAVRVVPVQTGLRSGHFYRETHAAIYMACIRVAARGEGVDAITVWDELCRSETPPGITRERLNELAGFPPSPGNAPHYARIVIETAELRGYLAGARQIQQGVHDHDRVAIQEGIEAVAKPVQETGEPAEPNELSHAVWEYLNAKGEPEVFELPWPSMNEHIGAGGFLRGEFTILTGWTNLGKSIALDQMLRHFHEQGKRCWLFCTEMGWLERSLRHVTAETAVPYSKLIRRQPLTEQERTDVRTALDAMPFGFRDASGWPATQISQEIVARKVDIAAIDPLNLIPFKDTREYDEVLRQLKETAVRANCHIVAISQLNMARFRDQNPPSPALRDIRDSGNAQYIASHIVSVHRTYRDGEPTKTGEIRFLKVRNGVTGRCKVEFIPGAFRFVEPKPAPPPEPSEVVMDFTGTDEAD